MPKISQSLKSLEQTLPSLIKARRLELGLTLQEVADKTELSAAFISQSERGKTTPSLISLIQIAEALQTDIHYFISPPKPDTLIKRADSQIKSPLNTHSDADFFSLESELRNQRLSCLKVHLPTGHRSKPKNQREGEDFIYVLKGEVEVIIEEKHFLLAEGDSTHFNSQVSYELLNPSLEESIILWVATPTLSSN